MGYLNDLLRKIELINVPDVSESVIAESENFLVEMQQAQMLHGFDRHGKKIGQYKNENYAHYKYGLNPEAGFPFVDLRREGDFYRGITATVIGEELVLDSSDEKTPDLVEKYGERIFGLNDEFKHRYIDEALRPSFKIHIKQILNLPFTGE